MNKQLIAQSHNTDIPICINYRIMTLHLVTYGLGKDYDANKFTPIKNRLLIKPFGGLWSSPSGCRYGWREWCNDNDYGDLSTHFITEYTGRTLVINSVEDLSHIVWQDVGKWKMYYPDYEAMQSNGIDAIYLTDKGERETRFTEPGLYGYDCECILVMNPSCLTVYNYNQND